MDGLLIIDKPTGLTSHDVVMRVRRKLKTKKVGHTGTLDPFATGVMVILVGKATRLARFLDKDQKEYLAVLALGEKTDTGDLTGNVIKTSNTVSNAEIVAVLENFKGEQMQLPPMYSAKKVDGKKLYELARKGVEIEREPIKINVKELEIVDDDDCKLKVLSSAGTFIRTLAEDIAEAAGSAAHLKELRRTKAGRFGLEDSVTLDEFIDSDQAETYLLPFDMAADGLKKFNLNSDRAEKTKNGLATRCLIVDVANDEYIAICDENEQLIAIGIYDNAAGELRPKVVL